MPAGHRCNGSLGPMARTVTDLAKLLDVMVGYDPDDPVTARGVGQAPASFQKSLDANGAARRAHRHSARVDGLRCRAGFGRFRQDHRSLRQGGRRSAPAGAEIVDPIVIPDLKALLAKRATSVSTKKNLFRTIWGGVSSRRIDHAQDAMNSPDFTKVVKRSRERWGRTPNAEAHYEYLKARDELMTQLLTVMADHKLDAIVHKAVEHQPTLIKDGVNPPFVDQKGAPHINTFLMFVPSIVVPAGFTRDNLPAGITFLGRPYDDAKMIRFAYAYEQATHHRKPAPSVTPL